MGRDLDAARREQEQKIGEALKQFERSVGEVAQRARDSLAYSISDDPRAFPAPLRGRAGSRPRDARRRPQGACADASRIPRTAAANPLRGRWATGSTAQAARLPGGRAKEAKRGQRPVASLALEAPAQTTCGGSMPPLP
mmetsp:Transcript_1606/g.4800  ORF Transcript_1606/g.4800 Transcript_1606/m.4800 type:complete len:139 (+) Transcript_1606:214-630(+)